MAVRGDADRAVARLAASQGAQITSGQLRDCGLTWAGVRARVERGQLTRISHGVYAVGCLAIGRDAAEWTAVLRLGPDAVLSHGTGVGFWELGFPRPERVAVTLVGSDRRAPGFDVHRVASLHPADRRCIRGLPVTAPARTLIDFAAGATRAELERALNEARVLKLVTDGALRAALARSEGRPGAAEVFALLDAESDAGAAGFTRREAERRLRALIRDAGIAPAIHNALVTVGGRRFEVDALWPAQRLVVEIDGWAYHRERRSFERDRQRDRILVAGGYRVIRITWRQLMCEPLAVAAALAAALACGQCA